ncbi:MAG: T9SS type A sorting domain-containing protein, partial [Bacteroidia bacterium]|nr:T9SS type A sorting domain-containing protein [Bacteroidia bacterium]
MKKYFILIVIALFTISVNAQIITISNQKTFGGWLKDYISSVIMLDDGSYIIGGYSYSGISGDKTVSQRGVCDYWVVHFNPELIPQWQKAYGGDSIDGLISMIRTSDGNILLAGSSYSSISGDKTAPKIGRADYWVLKIDTTGNILWQKTYGGTDIDFLRDIAEFEDGSLLLAGYSISGISGDKTDTSRGSFDYWIIKTDQDGTVLWDKTLGGESFDGCFNISISQNNEIILTGSSESNISGEKSEDNYGIRNIWIIKLDIDGNIIWDRTIGGDFYESYAYTVFVNDNLFTLANSRSDASGTKTEDSKGEADYWLTKLDNNGNIQWDKTIGGSLYDEPQSITVSSNGDLILTGTSLSSISGDKTENTNGAFDFWIVCVDTTGNLLWQKTIGGSDYDIPVKTIEISPNNFLLVGQSESGISGDKTEYNRGYEDYWLVEVSLIVNVPENQNNEILILTYPNPSSKYINIDIRQEFSEQFQLIITDISGKTIGAQKLVSGKNTIDIETLSSGLYTFTIVNAE